MKTPSLAIALHAALLSIAAALPFSAGAESVIKQANEPYAVNPEIRFVVVATPAPAAIPLASAAMPAPAQRDSFEMKKGKRVDEQLRAYGKRSGWDMVWQAPDYVLDRDMVIEGDFEAAVLSFLNGANEAGARLRAVFYRGNKTVRVTEF